MNTVLERSKSGGFAKKEDECFPKQLSVCVCARVCVLAGQGKEKAAPSSGQLWEQHKLEHLLSMGLRGGEMYRRAANVGLFLLLGPPLHLHLHPTPTHNGSLDK